MDESIPAQPTPRTAAEYRAEFRKLLDEMARIHERMERDREISERMRARTAATGSRIDAKLAEMEAALKRLQETR